VVKVGKEGLLVLYLLQVVQPAQVGPPPFLHLVGGVGTGADGIEREVGVIAEVSIDVGAENSARRGVRTSLMSARTRPPRRGQPPSSFAPGRCTTPFTDSLPITFASWRGRSVKGPLDSLHEVENDVVLGGG
jgi:hypothetical protein